MAVRRQWTPGSGLGKIEIFIKTYKKTFGFLGFRDFAGWVPHRDTILVSQRYNKLYL